MSKRRILTHLIACVVGALLFLSFRWGSCETLQLKNVLLERNKSIMERRVNQLETNLNWAVQRGVRAEAMWRLCRQGLETPAQ